MKIISFFLLFISILSAKEPEQIHKTYITWDEVSLLSENVQGQITTAAYHPDILIGISRGGLIPARLLSDLLHNNSLYIIRIAFYKEIGKTEKEPRLLQGIDQETIQGKNILLIDDVADSGKSLDLAINYLNTLHPQNIKTATLHYKKHSCIKPDFFGKEETTWLVYPWELKESK
jgi:hypothetical protein